MAGYCESEYEAAILDLLMSLGWKRSRGDELHRKYSDALILDDLDSSGICVGSSSPDFGQREPVNKYGESPR